MIEVKVIYSSESNEAYEIRTLFCQESKREGNPLMETNFNSLLQKIVQDAFDAGRTFEKNNPKIKI
jgi:hypothetical protein